MPRNNLEAQARSGHACRLAVPALAMMAFALPDIALAYEAGVTSYAVYSASVGDFNRVDNNTQVDSVTSGAAQAHAKVHFDTPAGDSFRTSATATAEAGRLVTRESIFGAAIAGSSSGGPGGDLYWSDSFTIHPDAAHPEGTRGTIRVSVTACSDAYSNGTGDDQVTLRQAKLGFDPGLGDGGKVGWVEYLPAQSRQVVDPGVSEFVYGRPIIVSALLSTGGGMHVGPHPEEKEVSGRFGMFWNGIVITDGDTIVRELTVTSDSGFDYQSRVRAKGCPL